VVDAVDVDAMLSLAGAAVTLGVWVPPDLAIEGQDEILKVVVPLGKRDLLAGRFTHEARKLSREGDWRDSSASRVGFSGQRESFPASREGFRAAEKLFSRPERSSGQRESFPVG
jgi:hypothetical protein